MMTALGDPTRQAIFERLSVQPSPVGVLAADLPISRPAVSQHLKVLKAAGLVTGSAVGTRRVYSVDAAGVAAIRDYFDQFGHAPDLRGRSGGAGCPEVLPRSVLEPFARIVPGPNRATGGTAR